MYTPDYMFTSMECPGGQLTAMLTSHGGLHQVSLLQLLGEA